MTNPKARLSLGRLRSACLWLPLFALAAGTASAQPASQWPDRPVRLIVPLGAGGASDTLARHLANGFSQFANGQPLVVENRPGGGGTIGAAAAAREKPNGYTLFLTDVTPNAAAHVLMPKLSYDPHTAFTPIIHVAEFPGVFLVRPALPYKTLAEYIDAAKQQPDKFTYATAGVGNWTHLFMEDFNNRVGIKQVTVPYRSGADIVTALLRNEADAAIMTVSTSVGQLRDGKLRALAVTSTRPVPLLPDMPLVSQTVPGFSAGVWHGIAGPAGMEPELVARINSIFNQVLQVPAVRTGIAEGQGAEIIGGTPQQFSAFLKSELKRWPEVVKASKITLE
ncbi:MAG: tripartite tricarboxylate transporter substrate binding protein [Xanthobacteraceae bacterium]|nr:tripartite tricarboxylate transporter substrate binding protein [Xanthobacteraceae bacterium]